MIETKTIHTFKYSDLKPLIYKYYSPNVELTPELLATLIYLGKKGVHKFEEIEDLKMLIIRRFIDASSICYELHTLQKVVIAEIKLEHGVDFNEETMADTYFIDFDR